MLLSQTSKYAVRAVLHLAQNDGHPWLSRDIARVLDIPEHFLAKIMQNLSKSGLLHSAKGRGGGFRLAKPAGEIQLLEVVRAIDGSHFGEACILGLPECSEENPCPLHNRWSDIKEEILCMLGAKNVVELAETSIPSSRSASTEKR